MATFSDDFSTRSGTATQASPTAIGGWTLQADSGSASYISATIQTDATALGGQSLRLVDTGWGGGLILAWPTAIGSVGTGVATEVLTSFKLGDITTNSAGFYRAVVAAARTLLGGTYGYGVCFERNSNISRVRGWLFNAANDWSALGTAKTITADLGAGEWWWARIAVTAAGSWSWKVWEGPFSAEPGSWDVTGVSDTTNTSGYVGVGSSGGFTARDPIDFQWFSVGTAGDPAPEPSGGGGIVYGVPLRQPRPNVPLRM